MALFETLGAMLTGKAAAAAATLTIVSGTAAGATGTLPQGLQSAFDNVAGVDQESDVPVEDELDSLQTDTVTDDVSETDATPGDTDEGATEDEVVDTDETEDADKVEEVEEVEETDERSDTAEQVLTDLGDGCMPEADDCDFGQAVAENAREKGAEHAAEGKARAEENKARRGAPDEIDTTDEPDTTDETTAPEETEATSDAPEADEGEAAAAVSPDGPGASNRPDHAGR